MAALAYRRMMLLPTPPHLPPAPQLLSSAAAGGGLSDGSLGRQGRISWPSSSSRSHVFYFSHPPRKDSHQPGLFRAPPTLPCQGPQSSPEGHTAAAEARARGAARQERRMTARNLTWKLWRTHTTALNTVPLFGRGFSQPTPHIKSERFGFMATGGSSHSGGFATSSVLKETVNARGAGSARDNDFELLAGDPQKFVTFETKDGQIAVGVIRGDTLWSLQDVFKSSDGKPLPQVSDMASVIINWSDLKDRLIVEGSGTKVSEFKLLAPIPRPAGVIMCIGKNYLDHVKEVDTWKTAPDITKPEAPKHPIVFTKAPQSVIGPGAAIKYPHGVSSAVDYEAELGVIIGKAGQSIKREDAMSHIFGYTIINDVTARDLQKRHQQWFIGKSCDTFCPMGPAIVPASEIDGNDLQIQCWVNDELRQDGRTSQMIFGIPELIEVISAAITLRPGDIIATGTPAGVGSGFNPPRHLSPGDKIRISIEGIGELCNTVE